MSIITDALKKAQQKRLEKQKELETQKIPSSEEIPAEEPSAITEAARRTRLKEQLAKAKGQEPAVRVPGPGAGSQDPENGEQKPEAASQKPSISTPDIESPASKEVPPAKASLKSKVETKAESGDVGGKIKQILCFLQDNPRIALAVIGIIIAIPVLMLVLSSIGRPQVKQPPYPTETVLVKELPASVPSAPEIEIPVERTPKKIEIAPKRVPRHPKKVQPYVNMDDLPVLSGIMYTPAHPRAILNGLMVLEGEILNGFTVSKIHPSKVILSVGEREFELKLR